MEGTSVDGVYDADSEEEPEPPHDLLSIGEQARRLVGVVVAHHENQDELEHLQDRVRHVPEDIGHDRVVQKQVDGACQGDEESGHSGVFDA